MSKLLQNKPHFVSIVDGYIKIDEHVTHDYTMLKQFESSVYGYETEVYIPGHIFDKYVEQFGIPSWTHLIEAPNDWDISSNTERAIIESMNSSILQRFIGKPSEYSVEVRLEMFKRFGDIRPILGLHPRAIDKLTTSYSSCTTTPIRLLTSSFTPEDYSQITMVILDLFDRNLIDEYSDMWIGFEHIYPGLMLEIDHQLMDTIINRFTYGGLLTEPQIVSLRTTGPTAITEMIRAGYDKLLQTKIELNAPVDEQLMSMYCDGGSDVIPQYLIKEFWETHTIETFDSKYLPFYDLPEHLCITEHDEHMALVYIMEPNYIDIDRALSMTISDEMKIEVSRIINEHCKFNQISHFTANIILGIKTDAMVHNYCYDSDYILNSNMDQYIKLIDHLLDYDGPLKYNGIHTAIEADIHHHLALAIKFNDKSNWDHIAHSVYCDLSSGPFDVDDSIRLLRENNHVFWDIQNGVEFMSEYFPILFGGDSSDHSKSYWNMETS